MVGLMIDKEIKLDLEKLDNGTNIEKYWWIFKRIFLHFNYTKIFYKEIGKKSLKEIAKEKNMFVGQMIEKLILNWLKENKNGK